MYAEPTPVTARQPVMPARLPVVAALLWIGALLASAAPWFGELDPVALVSAFWTFTSSDYASVLAHYSWAPGLPSPY